MNAKKPDRPKCSNLSRSQWSGIVNQIEHTWDLKLNNHLINARLGILNDIHVLTRYSLITPEEAETLEQYNWDCSDEYFDETGGGV